MSIAFQITEMLPYKVTFNRSSPRNLEMNVGTEEIYEAWLIRSLKL